MPKQTGKDDNDLMKDRQSLFREHPPFSMAMALGFLILLIFGVAVAGAFLVQVPETIRCPFVLIPDGGADPVRSTSTGYLEKINAEEKQTVHKGQVLFIIRAREMRGWLSDLRGWSTDMRIAEEELASLERIRALRLQSHQAAIEIQRAKMAQNEKDLAYQKTYLATYRDVLQRMEKLSQEGLIPPIDLISQRLGASKAERDVAMTEQSREMGSLELRQLRTDYDKQVAEDDLEMQKISVRIAGLKRQMAGNPADLASVSAPFDGVILKMERKILGDAVADGQELCRIARSDCSLVAEMSPPEEGLPRLQPGQPVQLFYQAFPYQRYGTASAVLRWLSPVALQSSEGERFVAHAVLQSQSMQIQGEARPLKAGMRGESRIFVGRRSLIEYAFDPIRQLKENLKPGK